MQDRIRYLDGLRGVAILLVLLYHLFERWHDLMPYGDFTSNIFPFNVGYLGVNLFFLISGFVILLTLEKSNSRAIFLWRRWLRLFPAMLVGTLVIYIVALILPERPNGPAELKNVLPGLTFIQPILWKVIGVDVSSIEGAFWSLYVEAQFYLFACLIYFSFGTRPLIYATVTVFIITSIIFKLEPVLDGNAVYHVMLITANISNFHHFGWFSSGSLFYLYTKNNQNSYLIFGLLMAILSATQISQLAVLSFLSAVAVSFLFVSCLKYETPGKIMSNPMFIFFGYISYPLYLIHENFLIGSIIELTKYFPMLPVLLLPIAPLILVIVVAYLIATHAEPYVKSRLSSLYFSDVYKSSE